MEAILTWFGRSVVFALFVSLAACTSPLEEETVAKIANTKEQIKVLGKMLDNKTLPKAAILVDYIDKLSAAKPEYESVLKELGKEASSENTLLVELSKRLNIVEGEVNYVRSWRDTDLPQRLRIIGDAVQPSEFEKNLVDPINTVAALSDGMLQPLDLPADQKLVAGENLVGNETYGRWQNGSSGTFWQWYAPYVMFSTFYGPRPYYYSRWYYNRPWSYHYDVYGGRYGSARWQRQEADLLQRNRSAVNAYGKQNGRNPSQYANRKNSRYSSNYTSSFAQNRSNIASGKPQIRRTSSYGSGSRSSYGASTRTGSRGRSGFGGK